MESLPSVIHETWHPYLFPLFQTNGMNYIKRYLEREEFLPKAKDIFNVFSMPLNEIKVIILGQDPYPTPGDAIGYAFAVSESTKKPPSLRMIEKEVGHEIDRTLKPWRDQGVFLLNTALTVKPKSAASHLTMWNGFTSHVIRIISEHKTAIWLLWGKYAQRFAPIITNYSDNQIILQSPHPAAEVYAGGKAGFIGCGHFNIVNQILAKTNQEQIKF